MTVAKYYIYRNLRTKGWSVKYKGRVIDHSYTLSAMGVEFKVSQAGRHRVIVEKRKNVHAFVVCDKYIVKKYPVIKKGLIDNPDAIRYNPYLAGCFVYKNRPITYAEEVVLQNGLCILVR